VRRLTLRDPRTVAREIPGVFDAIFPQLTPGVVAHFNRTAEYSDIPKISHQRVVESRLQSAMLFEIAFALGEARIVKENYTLEECIKIAVNRQRRYFDAKLPTEVTSHDLEIAEDVASNMERMISAISTEAGLPALAQPSIPGLLWIGSGKADFSVGNKLIEVKCSGRNFSAADYRQVAMYWLLSYAKAIENDSMEWTSASLVNPRLSMRVDIDLDNFLHIVSAGRSKVDIFQMFTQILLHFD
jgi:hypothetical protein